VCCHLHIQVLSVKLTNLNSVFVFLCVTKLHIETFFKVILNSFIAVLYPSPCLKLSLKVNLKMRILSCFHSLCFLLFSPPSLFFFPLFFVLFIWITWIMCIVNHFVWLCICIRRIKCLSVCHNQDDQLWKRPCNTCTDDFIRLEISASSSILRTQK